MGKKNWTGNLFDARDDDDPPARPDDCAHGSSGACEECFGNGCRGGYGCKCGHAAVAKFLLLDVPGANAGKNKRKR